PTLSEVEELTGCGADVIALDATARTRPGRVALPDIVKTIRARHPRQLLMADISTPAEARDAERLGFDMVATTLYGYTRDTAGRHLYDDDFAFLRQVVAACRMPVIAEGNVLTPEAARRTIELGAWAVVVGGAITRPQHITRRFAMALTPAAR
ncbi:MAG: tRNA-dihydrouridine synthase, partial [Negativicutes bacterium]|nr:tRNA-dihydrouridine synthase [Negativicutes bacterium]